MAASITDQLTALGIDPHSTIGKAATRLDQINNSRTLGATWASVAAAIGCRNGKEAKRYAHMLTRDVDRALLLRQAQNPDATGDCPV